MSNIRNNLESYFDKIADRYAGFYGPEGKALHRLRLELAIEGFNFDDQKILDVGAGTGALYDALKKNTSQFEYQAIDVSKKMLEASQIPDSDRFHGDFKSFSTEKKYDYIFVLGVINYLDEKEENALEAFIHQYLKPEGWCIFSLTNRTHYWNLLRLKLKTLIKRSDAKLWKKVRLTHPDEIPLPSLERQRVTFFNPFFSWHPSVSGDFQKASRYSDFLVKSQKRN